MPLLLIFSAASFMAVLASHSDLSLQIGRRMQETGWPTPPARGLASHIDRGRGLDSKAKAKCVRSLLSVASPDTLTEWQTCVETKAKTMHKQIAGEAFGIYLDCWCESNVEEVLTEYGCCQHPDFYMMCEAQCPDERNCGSAEAQACLKNCPAVCLESDYAPEFCSIGCQGCVKHLGCIIEHSKNQTLSGSHAFLCNDVGFDNSSEWKKWQTCYVEHPKRTHWHRHNAENYCYCESNLKSAAMVNQCCDAKWSGTICDEQCSQRQTNTIDCNGAEAKSCAEACKETCPTLYEHTIGEACQKLCFDKTSRCNKYSVCPPAESIGFDYVCDSEKEPLQNGCCVLNDNSLGCPLLCDSWAPHLPQHMVAGYELQHGWECQCMGCPNTTKAAQNKWKDALENHLEEHGQAQLYAISKKVGILGPNRRMQELMYERNLAIMKAYQEHQGVPDQEFERKIQPIVEDYQKQIEAEAIRFKENDEQEDESGTSAPELDKLLGKEATGGAKGGTVKEGSSNTGVVIGAIAAGAGFIILIGIMVMVYKMKGKSRTARGQPNPGQSSPYDGDTNVVMGRPIEGETAAASSDATQGAPVQPGGKGQEDNSKV